MSPQTSLVHPRNPRLSCVREPRGLFRRPGVPSSSTLRVCTCLLPHPPDKTNTENAIRLTNLDSPSLSLHGCSRVAFLSRLTSRPEEGGSWYPRGRPEPMTSCNSSGLRSSLCPVSRLCPQIPETQVVFCLGSSGFVAFLLEPLLGQHLPGSNLRGGQRALGEPGKRVQPCTISVSTVCFPAKTPPSRDVPPPGASTRVVVPRCRHTESAGETPPSSLSRSKEQA